MAAARKIVAVFADTNGKTMTLSWNYAASEIEQSDVTALINGIITNGSIYSVVPAKCKSFKVVKSEDQDYDVPA